MWKACVPLILLAGCAAEPPQSAFKAQQEVTLAGYAKGCQSIYDARDAEEHFQRREGSAAGTIWAKDSCFSDANREIRFTVHQTDGLMVQVGISSMDQYAAAREERWFDPAQTYWVAERFVRAVQ